PTGVERHHTQPDTALGVHILAHLYCQLDLHRIDLKPRIRRLPGLPRDLQLLTHHPHRVSQIHPLALDHHRPPRKLAWPRRPRSGAAYLHRTLTLRSNRQTPTNPNGPSREPNHGNSTN